MNDDTLRADIDDALAVWSVSLDEPATTEADAPVLIKFPEPTRDIGPAEGFVLRGEELPSDGVYRPRLRGFGDAA